MTASSPETPLVNWKKPFGLAIGLLVLSTGAFWFQYRVKPDKEKTEAASQKAFFGVDLKVASFEIQGPKLHVSFQCDDLEKNSCKFQDQSSWTMQSPLKTKADAYQVNSVLSAIDGLKNDTTIDLSQDSPEKKKKLLDDYGLSVEKRSLKDAKKITLNFHPSGTGAVYVGTTSEVTSKAYVLFEKDGVPDENKVLLVPTSINQKFALTASAFRDKKIVDLEKSNVASMTLKNSNGSFFFRWQNGAWEVSQGGSEWFPGEAESIDGMLAAAANLRAKDFAADDHRSGEASKKLASATQGPLLTVTTKKEPPEVFDFRFFTTADKPPKAFLKTNHSTPLYEMDGTLPDRFKKKWIELRNTHLINAIERAATVKIKLESKAWAKPHSLTYQQTHWVTDVSDFGEIDTLKINNLLDRMQSKVVSAFNRGNLVPQKESLTLILGEETSADSRSFLFTKSGAKILLKDLKSQKSEYFELDNSIAALIPWKPESLKKPIP